MSVSVGVKRYKGFAIEYALVNVSGVPCAQVRFDGCFQANFQGPNCIEDAKRWADLEVEQERLAAAQGKGE